MQISLTKNSEVPLRHQLAEQIVFLITTGQLRSGEELPSVRTLARLLKIHHNTVSEAYQDLVSREWLTRKRGSRLTVGQTLGKSTKAQPTLDEIINDTIQRAGEMGYSLQALREGVRERLLAQPPDHVLVVEEDLDLRKLICHEIRENIGWPVQDCSVREFEHEPGLAVGAQVIAPNHVLERIKAHIPENQPAIPVMYGSADEHLEAIDKLEKPSIIAVASISEILLKTARGLLAGAVTRKHAFQEFLLSNGEQLDLNGVDLVFCDTIAMPLIICRQKFCYRLIGQDCVEQLATVLSNKGLETSPIPKAPKQSPPAARQITP